MGIEPTQSAWKAEVLPLNYTRKFGARNRTRTGTAVTPADFESAASTNFAIRACVPYYYNKTFIIKQAKNKKRVFPTLIYL